MSSEVVKGKRGLAQIEAAPEVSEEEVGGVNSGGAIGERSERIAMEYAGGSGEGSVGEKGERKGAFFLVNSDGRGGDGHGGRPEKKLGEAALREREAQIKRYLPLIKKVVSRLMLRYPPIFEEDELIDIGVIGLIEALNRYTPRGITFEQYAELRIRGAILDELRRNDLFSRSLRQQVKQFNLMKSRLEHQLGKDPSSEELAEAMNVSSQTVEKIRVKAQPIQFIDIDSVESSPIGNLRALADSSLLPDDIAHRSELREKVLRAMNRLPERERLILHLYYFEDLTMRKIGEFIGLSESRICQLHRKACKTLRFFLEEENISEGE